MVKAGQINAATIIPTGVGSFRAKKPAYRFDMATDHALRRFAQSFRQSVNFIKGRVHPIAPFGKVGVGLGGVGLWRFCFQSRLPRIKTAAKLFVGVLDIDKANPAPHGEAAVKPTVGLVLAGPLLSDSQVAGVLCQIQDFRFHGDPFTIAAKMRSKSVLAAVFRVPAGMLILCADEKFNDLGFRQDIFGVGAFTD